MSFGRESSDKLPLCSTIVYHVRKQNSVDMKTYKNNIIIVSFVNEKMWYTYVHAPNPVLILCLKKTFFTDSITIT